VADDQQQVPSGVLIGRLLCYQAGWLAKLLPMLQAMITPCGVCTMAIWNVLLHKGLVTWEELQAAKAEARAGFAIENSIGAPAQAIEQLLKEFHDGAVAALMATIPHEKEEPHG
jgi:hypothetical protein